MRILLSVVLLVHGLIHAMGFAKAFDFAKLAQLKLPISRSLGVVWLLAGLAICATAFLPWRWLWLVGIPALLLSQVAIVCSWSDAKFGTIANVLLLVAIIYSFASFGPTSLRRAYESDVRQRLDLPAQQTVLSDAELQPLPIPIQKYLRFSGAVGKPKPQRFRAHWTGRIRGAASDPWMEFVAEQVNTYGRAQDRLFFMDAVMKGLPVDVYHRFVGSEATARVKLLSLVSIVDAKGAEMNRAETVTLFNDIALLAPAWLADPAIRWEPIDDFSARATFSRGTESISAVLYVDTSGMLVNFVSDDRLMAGKEGKSFARVRWSTPLRDPKMFGSLRLGSRGEGRWHPQDAADFSYIELELIDLEYDGKAP